MANTAHPSLSNSNPVPNGVKHEPSSLPTMTGQVNVQDHVVTLKTLALQATPYRLSGYKQNNLDFAPSWDLCMHLQFCKMISMAWSVPTYILYWDNKPVGFGQYARWTTGFKNKYGAKSADDEKWCSSYAWQSNEGGLAELQFSNAECKACNRMSYSPRIWYYLCVSSTFPSYSLPKFGQNSICMQLPTVVVKTIKTLIFPPDSLLHCVWHNCSVLLKYLIRHATCLVVLCLSQSLFYISESNVALRKAVSKLKQMSWDSVLDMAGRVKLAARQQWHSHYNKWWESTSSHWCPWLTEEQLRAVLRCLSHVPSTRICLPFAQLRAFLGFFMTTSGTDSERWDLSHRELSVNRTYGWRHAWIKNGWCSRNPAISLWHVPLNLPQCSANAYAALSHSQSQGMLSSLCAVPRLSKSFVFQWRHLARRFPFQICTLFDLWTCSKAGPHRICFDRLISNNFDAAM